MPTYIIPESFRDLELPLYLNEDGWLVSVFQKQERYSFCTVQLSNGLRAERHIHCSADSDVKELFLDSVQRALDEGSTVDDLRFVEPSASVLPLWETLDLQTVSAAVRESGDIELLSKDTIFVAARVTMTDGTMRGFVVRFRPDEFPAVEEGRNMICGEVS